MESHPIKFPHRFPNKVRDSGVYYFWAGVYFGRVPLPEKKKLGISGEIVAEKYLLSRGYKIIKRNWYCYAGELDIVAFKNKLIFVEVKTLSRKVGEDPSVMLTRRKRLKWYHTSNYFLLRHKLLGSDWRFDFVGVIKDNNKYLLRHYKNISIP